VAVAAHPVQHREARMALAASRGSWRRCGCWPAASTALGRSPSISSRLSWFSSRLQRADAAARTGGDVEAWAECA
jgi:hypothetical protein